MLFKCDVLLDLDDLLDQLLTVCLTWSNIRLSFGQRGVKFSSTLAVSLHSSQTDALCVDLFLYLCLSDFVRSAVLLIDDAFVIELDCCFLHFLLPKLKILLHLIHPNSKDLILLLLLRQVGTLHHGVMRLKSLVLMSHFF